MSTGVGCPQRRGVHRARFYGKLKHTFQQTSCTQSVDIPLHILHVSLVYWICSFPEGNSLGSCHLPQTQQSPQTIPSNLSCFAQGSLINVTQTPSAWISPIRMVQLESVLCKGLYISLIPHQIFLAGRKMKQTCRPHSLCLPSVQLYMWAIVPHA